MYNTEEYIIGCLDSLLDQDLDKSDYEIIVVNDGSTDNSLSLAQDYSLKHSNAIINLIDKKNEGLSVTRNIAIDVAKGKYIYFVDADDYIASNVLKTIVNYLDENHLDILTFQRVNTNSTNLKTSQNFDKINKEITVTDGLTYIANNNYHNAVWTYVINRNFLLESNITFIKDLYLEDCVFTPSLFLKAKRMSFLNIDVYRYMQHQSDSIMKNRNIDHLKKIVESHYRIVSELTILINKLKDDDCIKRLKNRKETLVFYLIIRLIKSNLKASYINKVIKEFKSLK